MGNNYYGCEMVGKEIVILEDVIMNRDYETELRMKDKEINDLRDALRGTIKENGSLENCYGLYSKWQINTSSILTSLIKEAGRWCNYFSSDLFVLWKYNIDRKLENGTLDTGTYVFAFWKGGVDDNEWYEKNKNKRNYYNVVWFLDVSVDGNKIEMILHQ